MGSHVWSEAESRLVDKLAAFVRLVRELGTVRDAQQIYEPALSALQAIAGVDRSSIMLLDPSGRACFVSWRGISEAYRDAVAGHFPWALDDPAPRPILIEDVRRAPAIGALLPALERERIRAVGFIPLLYNERLVGKFMIYYEQPHDFVEEEVELANAVAYLVAFAIERTRLHAALQESDRRKDTFLAMLGHELRNPLAAASAALAVVSERGDDLTALHKVRKVLGRSIGQIVKLVDDLLDVSRITRGVIAIDPRPVDLTSIVHHAIAPVQTLIAVQHHEITLSLESLWVMADAIRLEQVITNLIQNAAKYTPEGGHIRVSTRSRGAGVEIRVEDDGIGLDPHEIPRLFELFEQADKSLARTTGGLGIGLTIVHELVRLHGGTVHATSAGPGFGSTFIVRLPNRIEAPPVAREAVPKGGRAPHHRVLVVDDNEEVASTLAILLEARGHNVSIAPNGPAAIEAVTRQAPEIILLDIGLPGMSGYDVATRLRSGGWKGELIAVSGYGQPQDVERAHAAGCDAHLTKPIDIAALDRVLDRLDLH
jgi:signal transduction histidine kinase/CheY-like chemotaxis protein